MPRQKGCLKDASGVFFDFEEKMKKTEKIILVQNLIEQLKSSNSVILLDYSGLNVKQQQELKRRLKDASAEFLVVKNTLLKRAVYSLNTKENLLDTVLSGPTALVITEGDPLKPIQVIYKFAQEFGVPNFKVGIVEGKFQTKQLLETLAQLPSKEVLLAQTIGAFSAPTVQLFSTFQENLKRLFLILQTMSKSKNP